MDGEEPERQAGCAGYLVLAVFIAGAVAGLYLISRTVFILVVWGVGWGAVLWVARKPVQATSNPAPPPLPEPSPDAKPQVSMLRDKSHPNRWIVTKPSRYLTEDNKKAETT